MFSDVAIVAQWAGKTARQVVTWSWGSVRIICSPFYPPTGD